MTVILYAVVYKGEDLPLALFKKREWIDGWLIQCSFEKETEIIEYHLKIQPNLTKEELIKKGYTISS